MGKNSEKPEADHKASIEKRILNVKSLHEYLILEREHADQIKVKRMYVDLAGDLVSGLVLSQLLYWFTPSKKTCRPKVSIERDGKLWLAKSRKSWWDEVRISPKQFDRACTILEGKGLIETALFKFGNSPVKHLRPNELGILEGVKSILTKGQNPNSRKGKMDVAERSNSYIIAETTDREYETHNTDIEREGSPTLPVLNGSKKEFVKLWHHDDRPYVHVLITPEEWDLLVSQYGKSDLWQAIDDLEDNIEIQPDLKKWQGSHAAILRKYLRKAARGY